MAVQKSIPGIGIIKLYLDEEEGFWFIEEPKYGEIASYDDEDEAQDDFDSIIDIATFARVFGVS